MATPASGPACHHCGAPLALGRGPIGRGQLCPKCGREVRVCRNCAFFAPGRNNDCREPGADRVADKERANFCEFFQLGAAAAGGAAAPSAGARAALDALFRKP